MRCEMRDKKWRFIQTGFDDLYTNMAIDEAMLIEHCKGATPPTLRIYRWKPPAISIGYFQEPKQELNINRCNEQGINFVRRITGGGIIFHNHELTYSLVCSKEEVGLYNSVKDSYREICLFLINAYKKLGLNAHFAIDHEKNEGKLGKPSSFCFASKEEYDILIESKKLGGNAQRRRQGVIFQHGSIPLRLDIEEITPFLKKDFSEIENKMCSLEEMLGKKINFYDLQNRLKESFEETFLVTLKEEDLNIEEKKLAQNLQEAKYKRTNWNLYRN